MTEARERESVFVFAMRHLRMEREIFVLKIKGQNFYALLTEATASLRGVDRHFSYHASGRRHVVDKRRVGTEWKEDKWPRPWHWERRQTTRRLTVTQLQQPSMLAGAELFFHFGILCGQFPELPQIGTKRGELVMLDTALADFRDDFTIIRGYLVEPNRENAIPIISGTGPRILHFVKRSTPWIAVEIVQQSLPQPRIATSAV